MAKPDGQLGERHPGQVLSSLAESGVPLTQGVATFEKSVSVSNLVDECAAAFRFDQDIAWRSIAMAIYRPHPTSWTAHHGEVVSFDRITKELLRHTRSRGSDEWSCWGTHALYTLAIFQQVNAQVGLWQDDSLEDSVQDALHSAAMRLETTLRSDGSWDEHWSLPGISRSILNSERRLLITGHHLEWLVLMRPEQRPTDSVLLLASEFVVRETEKLSVDERVDKICA